MLSVWFEKRLVLKLLFKEVKFHALLITTMFVGFYVIKQVQYVQKSR